jgi:putative phosphoesterase
VKIVVISDLHGNSDALSALPETGDELWVLGDLVNYGPQPAEVVHYVQTHAPVFVRGNHDNAVGFNVDPNCTPRYQAMAASTMHFSNAALDEKEKQFLRDMPLHRTEWRGGAEFFLVHAVPSDPLFGYCPEDSDRWSAEVERVAADYLLVGHTHTPFIRKLGKTTIVNPGSLGQPKTGRSNACYAVWEDGRIQLKEFPYAVDRTIQRIEKLPLSEEVKQDLSTVLRTGFV